MKKILLPFTGAALAALCLTAPGAAQTATATATYEVQAIDEVEVTGNPGALIIASAADLSGVSDASTTWSVTTNGSNKKVTGAIDLAMTTDVTLKVDLAAPTGATSAGAVALGTVAADLVTGIAEVQASELGVIYTLSALPSAGAVASTTRTVTYTITDGA